MNNLTPVTERTAPAATGLVPRDLEQAIRLAQIMAKGSLVPQHLQDKPADCLLVIEQAMRWNMSPFAVAQGTFVTKGKLGYLGTLMHAAVEQNAPVQGHLSYHFNGEGESLAVTVRGTLIGESEPREVTVRLCDARTDNVWWEKTPAQMLCYHGARVWARRHTPGVIFGAYSREELVDAMEEAPREVPNLAAEPEAPPPPPPPPEAKAPAWVILSSTDGTPAMFATGEEWLAAWRMRIAAVMTAKRGTAEEKVAKLGRMWAANAEVLDALPAGSMEAVQQEMEAAQLRLMPPEPEYAPAYDEAG
jgi:hypothetical protein